MAQPRTYADEFFPGYDEALNQVYGQQKKLTGDLIQSNEQLGQGAEAAFAAFNEAQKPTKFDKVGDVALALAGIFDIAKGGRKGRLSSEKYRDFREGRKQDKSEKRAMDSDSLLKRLKLLEFSGGLRSKNIGAMLGLAEQEGNNLQSRISTAIKGRESEADVAYKKAATDKLGEKPAEPTEEDKKQAGRAEIEKLILDQVNQEFSKYDELAREEYGSHAAWIIAKDRRRQELKSLYIKDEPGVPDGVDIPEQGASLEDILGSQPLFDISDLGGILDIPAQSTGVNLPFQTANAGTPNRLAKFARGY